MDYIDNINKSDTCNIHEFKQGIEYALFPDKTLIKSKSQKDASYIAAIGRIVKGRIINQDDFLISIKGFILYINQEQAVSKWKVRKSTAVHEARHLFDNLTQPKLMATRVIPEETGKDTLEAKHKIEEILNGHKRIKELKKTLREIISQMSVKTAINQLQVRRYSLLTERNAYKTQKRYLERDIYKNIPERNAIYNFTENKLQVDRKLRIIKELMSELIAKERRNNKDNLTG